MIEAAGQRFGRLVVIDEDPIRAVRGRRRWICRCECGNTLSVFPANLRGGQARSCGCGRRGLLRPDVGERNRIRAKTSGRSRGGECYSAEYRTWAAMRSRCSNPRNSNWPKYGARGIHVCERWDSYEIFLADMGRKPSTIHSIDRIDSTGNYEPGNCRWATPKEQARNSGPKRKAA